MDDMDDVQGNAILDQLNQRQIDLLLHYVEGTPKPEDADDFDHDVLFDLGLLVRAETVN